MSLPIPFDFWTSQRTKLFELLLPFALGVAGDATAEALKAIPAVEGGVDFGLLNRAVETWAQSYAYDLAKGITDNDARYLQKVIPEWMQSGEHLDKLKETLMGSGRWAPTRASTIATTEVTRMYAQGNMMAWAAAGVEQIEWRTARDELVCEICGPLHGQRVGMVPLPQLQVQTSQDATGGLGGFFRAINFSLEDYAVHHPPAHHNCRCWLQPVVVPAEPSGATPFDQWWPGQGDTTPSISTTPGGLVAAAAAGGKVAEHVKIPSSSRWDTARDMTKVIDSVHGSGALGEDVVVEMKTASKSASFLGQYRTVKEGGAATWEPGTISIRYDVGNQHLANTIVHEMGHFLDLHALGNGDLDASDMIAGVGLADVITAIKDSKTIKEFAQLAANKRVAIGFESSSTGTLQAAVTYLSASDKAYYLSNQEMWARAYAQYITLRSQNPQLLAAEEAMRALDGMAIAKGAKEGVPAVALVWGPQEFQPIAKAIDKALQDAGMRGAKP